MNFFSRSSTAGVLSGDAASVGGSGLDTVQAARSTTSSFGERVKRAFESVAQFVKEQPQWIVIGILYCWVWYTPMPGYAGNADGPLAWCWAFWLSISLPLGFQLFVPVAVGLLIWSQRAALTSQWRHLCSNFPEHHPKREGNLAPLVLGALLLIFSHFVVVKGFGVFAAIVIAIGVVYRLYGSVITRMLAMPFIVYLLMIPLPDTFVDTYFVGKTLNVELKVACLLLNLVHVQTINLGQFLQVNGNLVNVTTHIYSGFGVAAATALIALVYCLFRRAPAPATLWMVILGFIAALFLNIFRVIAIAITYGPQIDIAHFLASPIVSWIQIGFAFGLTLIAMRTQIKRINVKINTPLSVHHAVRMAGTGIETMALPLVGVGKLARLIGIGWTLSEKRLERLLKALTPKRKRRRSSSNRRR